MRARALVAGAMLSTVSIVGVVVGCSDGLTDDGGRSVTLADGSAAVVWGDGEYGVVLVPGVGEAPADWTPLAAEIAANRMTVVAVDGADATPERLTMAAAWLMATGIERVAYLGSGNRGAELLAAHAGEGAAVDQVILISGDLTDAELVSLGESPKLFVAAEEDAAGAAAATHMAKVAAGTWNALLLVPGADRGPLILEGVGADALTAGVVARLEERR